MADTNLSDEQNNGIISGWINNINPATISAKYNVAVSVVLERYMQWDDALSQASTKGD